PRLGFVVGLLVCRLPADAQLVDLVGRPVLGFSLGPFVFGLPAAAQLFGLLGGLRLGLLLRLLIFGLPAVAQLLARLLVVDRRFSFPAFAELQGGALTTLIGFVLGAPLLHLPLVLPAFRP